MAETRQIRVVDPLSDRRWDEYVVAHPRGSIYHHSGWVAALKAEFGQQTLGLAVTDVDGTVQGVLPLMLTKGLPLPRAGVTLGRRLSSLPRTPLAGPIGDDRGCVSALVAAAIERTPGRTHLQLKVDGPVLNDLAAGLTGHPWYEKYVLELPSSAEELRFGSARNHAAVKRAVNKAVREGVTVRFTDDRADLRAWHLLYRKTMRHHVFPPRPLRFFEALWDRLKRHDMARLLLAERSGDLLSGLLLLACGRTMYFAFNGVARDTFAQRPNDLLHWTAIHQAVAEGFRAYDFGEAAEGELGLIQFKRKWGSRPHRLYRYYHPPLKETPEVVGETAGTGHVLMKRAWQRLPLPLTSAAGEIVYRFL